MPIYKLNSGECGSLGVYDFPSGSADCRRNLLTETKHNTIYPGVVVATDLGSSLVRFRLHNDRVPIGLCLLAIGSAYNIYS